MKTRGTERWVLRLRPLLERGYTRGYVEHGQLILVQDVTGNTISLPMPSSVVERWRDSHELDDEDEHDVDVVVTEMLMSRWSTR